MKIHEETKETVIKDCLECSDLEDLDICNDCDEYCDAA